MKNWFSRAARLIGEAGMVVCGALFVLLLGAVIAAGIYQICEWCNLIRESRNADTAMAVDLPAEGVGRAVTVQRYAAPEEAQAARSLWVVCEDDPVLPAWWNPEDAVLVYSDTPKRDIGCPDWNVNSSIVGWDGHRMEAWEMDLFARIVYLEFNGTEPECMNAGIDSILNLWESGYFGRTIFETLSATAENGALVYTTYGYVWDWDYDYTVLQEIETLCMKRFINGPVYGCYFFQLYGFPWWAQPLYEIDHVYFSTFKEGTR